jgi:hypothetical protein
MGTIRMKIQALDWTMGEVGNVFIGLKGGECMIDWGDGHTSVIQAHPREVYPQYVSHVYPSNCKSSGDIFDVVISSTEDNIVFLNTGCIDMAILDLDLSDCPELERFVLTRPVKSLNTRFNKYLRELSIYNAKGISMDLSQNQALEQLQIKGYDKPILDISRCDKLWYLDCGNSEIREIAVSNQASLKEVIFWDHCPLDVNLKSFNFIRATIDRNNGNITILYEDQP